MDIVEPMLARLSRELPVGDYFYEPKWDGFRCLAAAGAGQVELYAARFRRWRPDREPASCTFAQLELRP